MLDVADAWSERYHRVDRSVEVSVSGGGSEAGLEALIAGSADIANASRAITPDELARARATGRMPIEHIVGYDALAVFLNPDNPIDSLTISELAAIYGEGGTTDSWSDLGVTVPGCNGDEILRVGWEEDSGTYESFEESVLGDREYKQETHSVGGSSGVVDAVARAPCAIGYGSLAGATRDVKTPCIGMSMRSPCIPPSENAARDGRYAIARPLFMYTSGLPEGALADYVNWILGDEGQCILAEMGYAPATSVDC